MGSQRQEGEAAEEQLKGDGPARLNIILAPDFNAAYGSLRL
jgi:hypothetical protein